MRRAGLPFQPLARRWRAGRSDASAAMFRRTRWRLTAWYTTVLGLTLMVIGLVLYLGERDRLMRPVDTNLQQLAERVAMAWQEFPLVPCPVGALGPDRGLLWACFDAQGRLLGADPLTRDVPPFLGPSLATAALQSGTATDSVNTSSETGSSIVRRYALRVSLPGTGQTLGVVEVGEPVGDRITALDTLLTLLLICGLLGLVAAAVSGFFLATRSLRPIRQAYLRQQDFIADASHELRTPLTMVRADAEVLLRDPQTLQPDQVAILQDVVQEVAHMGSLANNMLDLARLDAGRFHLEEDVVDLVMVAGEVARRAERLAIERAVAVRVDAGDPVLVIGDALLLEHVALILADNAIKYNRPGGEVVIGARRDGDRALLSVRDTGIGIAAEHLPHLGERFYRVDKARSRDGGGAGLGVSIARSIAARYGGSLRLTSQLHEGTTAILSLPSAGRQSLNGKE